VVVNQLAETFEVTMEVLGSTKVVWSIYIADQDQSGGGKVMGPLSRRDDLFAYTAFVLFNRDMLEATGSPGGRLKVQSLVGSLLFQSLDRNKDGRVTLSEARGDLNLGPRFDDIDINRDGVVTMEELQRYIRLQYGIQTDQASR